MAEARSTLSRREVLAQCVRGAGLLATSGLLGSLATRGHAQDMVWQIDPDKCTGCGECATACVLDPSAVKSMQQSGSLIPQVRHDRCLNCNRCIIASICPADAFVRVRSDEPYLLRTKKRD